MRPPLAHSRCSHCVTFFSKLSPGACTWKLGICKGSEGVLRGPLKGRGVLAAWTLGVEVGVCAKVPEARPPRVPASFRSGAGSPRYQRHSQERTLRLLSAHPLSSYKSRITVHI